MRTTTALLLRDEGYEVADAASVEEAVVLLAARPFDVVLTDLQMEPHDGLEMLRRANSIAPSTQVIVMTAYGTIESAVEAMRRGAFDYVAKPFKVPELTIRVEKAVERRRLLSQVSLFAEDFRRLHGLHSIVGQSELMRRLGQQIARAATSDATVLILGESGTGKELVARALHALSKRCDKPFVAVNCAAMTETLLDSELFGHAKGAFTGAIKARRGLFEEADGGTLFIDEVTETTLAFQAKLLRAIQEHEIRRIGESQPVKVDVRLVTATNQDLQRAVSERRFREDLYYRLAVVPLKVPPQRERLEDVPLLAQHFLNRYNTRSGMRRRLSADAVRHLCSWSYPGNVRELENAIERAAALTDCDELAPRDFPFVPAANGVGAPGLAFPGLPTADGSPPPSLEDTLASAEKGALVTALARNENDLLMVARELGISSTTLWRKMKRHKLTR
ncbi:MAG: sigma-54-dependent Fis family transcriptional regulator [Deltaproteobacteria bacterium]|nr:sigma-54-dependent Fis family transcriptional regulator [Deltaproteobacteria bacterium]